MSHDLVRHLVRTALVPAVSLTLAATLLAPDPTAAADPLPAAPPSPAGQAGTAGDGRSAATAAASCWEIAQEDPSADSGMYWLLTPTLQAPQQFYCDQETDGGGWVLVGRGRDDWTQADSGLGTPAQVAGTPSGTKAFPTAQLDADTVTGLLDGGAVDELTDGVRLHRATAADGSAWQDVTFSYKTARKDWSWQFTGRQQVDRWTVGQASGKGGSTAEFGRGDGLERVDTQVGTDHGWVHGFGYGKDITGSKDADSYLYGGGDGYAKPFTQVFLRPELRSQDIFSAIPDGGTKARTGIDTARSAPRKNPWGVTGLGAAGKDELNTEVAAFAEHDGIMYVGGNFRYVQRDRAGTDRVEQSYLAAFDAETGAWIKDFRPQLDNQVKALAVLPDGRLAVGGDFTSAGGDPASAFTVLDPGDGTPDPDAGTRFVNHIGATAPQIRSLDVQDGKLYVGGRFTHVTGPGSDHETYLRNIGRLDAKTLSPDPDWAPTTDGTVVSLDASKKGDRVYAAGYFGTSHEQETTERAAAYTTSDASVIPWTVDFSAPDGANYQQAVHEIGDRVWLGGSQHMLFSYDRDSLAEQSTNITQNGGDFQAIAPYGTGLAAGCHCSENVYEGARSWPTPKDFSRVEHIDQAGIWDPDGPYQPAFAPQVSLRAGHGAWAIHESENGDLWLGGDYTDARTPSTGKNQWTGGFVRYAATDTTAPSAPDHLKVARAGGKDTLSWDGVKGGSYEVLREDRVVATTKKEKVTLASSDDGARYFVRTVDAAGNRSASTPVATAAAGRDTGRS